MRLWQVQQLGSGWAWMPGSVPFQPCAQHPIASLRYCSSTHLCHHVALVAVAVMPIPSNTNDGMISKNIRTIMIFVCLRRKIKHAAWFRAKQKRRRVALGGWWVLTGSTADLRLVKAPSDLAKHPTETS